MAEGPQVDAGGVHKFLLAPFYLYEDLTSAAIPGVVFFLLLMLKKSELVHYVLAMPYLGYKTKIMLGLLMAYVVGKVFQIPSTIVLNVVENFDSGSMIADKPNEKGPLSDMFVGRGRHIVTGMIIGLLFPRIDVYDRWIIVRANLGFYFTTGLVLLTTSFFPGDGRLVWVERLVGTLLLIVGTANIFKLRNDSAMLIGLAVAGRFVGNDGDYEAKLKTALRILLGRSISSLRSEFLSAENGSQAEPATDRQSSY